MFLMLHTTIHSGDHCVCQALMSLNLVAVFICVWF